VKKKTLEGKRTLVEGGGHISWWGLLGRKEPYREKKQTDEEGKGRRGAFLDTPLHMCSRKARKENWPNTDRHQGITFSKKRVPKKKK